MDFLRISLFMGLVAHKAFWEIMKRKDSVRAEVKKNQTFFGLAAKAIKIGMMVFLIAQSLFLNILPISGAPEGMRFAGAFLFFAGLIMAIHGRYQLGTSWVDLEEAQVLSNQALVHSGLYRWIRHPIYTGDLLLILGLEVALQSWLVFISIPVFIVIIFQALKEEKLMAANFVEYGNYMKNTKRFIPFVI